MWLATKRPSGWPRSSWSIFFMCQHCLLLWHFSCKTNVLTTILYRNYQRDCFGFCLLSNGCLCVCRSFTNINATIVLNPLWTPSSLARDQTFALFSGRVFVSGMMFFLIFSTAVSDCQETHTQTWTFWFSFSCLLLYDFALPVYPVVTYKVLWVQQLGTGKLILIL